MFKFNMTKARQIHRDLIRIERDVILKKLDVDYFIALEQENILEQKRIAILKQKLRDIPSNPKINAAVSVDQLQLLTIEELLRD